MISSLKYCSITLIILLNFPASNSYSAVPKNQNERSSSRQFIKYGVVAAAEGLLLASDRDINKFCLKPEFRGKFTNSIFKQIEHLGRGGPYAIAIPLFAGYGFVFKSRKSVMVAGELLGGYALAQWVTLGFKTGFGRLRPYQSHSPYRFFKGGSSFYSGHTVSVFTIASVISLNYPRQDLRRMGIDHDLPLVPVVAYALASLVGLQRLYSNNHWSSDVFAGAIAGYSFAWLSVHFGNRYFLKPSLVMETGSTALGFSLGFN